MSECPEKQLWTDISPKVGDGRLMSMFSEDLLVFPNFHPRNVTPVGTETKHVSAVLMPGTSSCVTLLKCDPP